MMNLPHDPLVHALKNKRGSQCFCMLLQARPAAKGQGVDCNRVCANAGTHFWGTPRQLHWVQKMNVDPHKAAMLLHKTFPLLLGGVQIACEKHWMFNTQSCQECNVQITVLQLSITGAESSSVAFSAICTMAPRHETSLNTSAKASLSNEKRKLLRSN